MTETTPSHEERFEFQAEIKELLHLLVYSLYTKREIFLRELISNASDALDKMRYLNLTDAEMKGKDIPLEIRIDVDEKHKVLAVTDTGVGMTRAELAQHLGTIARSGSKEFLKQLEKGKPGDMNLIGQFGVGFYSSFMAASEVRVLTKSFHEDEPSQMWTSSGTGSYAIRNAPMERRGTRVELQLKDDAGEFVDAQRVRDVIKRYSNFVPYPIYLGDEQVNQVTALWMRPKGDVKTEEYEEFYKFLTNAFEGPASTLHLTSDAPLSFKSILFLPSDNLEKLGMGKLEHGPDLYAQKVLIQHNCKELVPDYLRFVRGVVDSEDITLNVSRETIQDNAVLRRISRHIVKQLLDHMARMMEDKRDEYVKFYLEFGRILKEGVAMDFENRERIAGLLLFNSSSRETEESLLSLKEYIEKMADGQPAIYYLTGPDRRTLEASPHLEMFRRKKVEVLYLYDPVDDFVLSQVREFGGKSLKSADQVAPDDLDQIASGKDEPEEAKAETMAFQSGFDALLRRFKDVLGDRITEVKESRRLTTSPCILVTPGEGPSIQVQKVLSMVDKNFEMGKRVLEVNKENPLIRNLVEIHKTDTDSMLVSQCCEQLFENAMLVEGLVPDASQMVARIQKIMEEATTDR